MTKSIRKSHRISKATTRSTSGAGYDFEDLAAAWLMLKMLRGISMPGIDILGCKIHWQTESYGWGKVDDLLIKGQEDNSENKNLAISCKSNTQVTSSGLPSEFVNAAWKLWDKTEPFRREQDSLMLLTRGSVKTFQPTWADIKGWCSDGNTSSAIAKIYSSNKHRKVFESIKTPKDIHREMSDKNTVELIKCLQVLPLDFQLVPSEYESNSLAYCRELLQESEEQIAIDVWNWLLKLAKEKRLVGGTVQLQELWMSLARNFNLKEHPNFSSSWDALDRATRESKNVIESTLPTGFRIERDSIKNDLSKRMDSDTITIVYGNSGCGKSAFVKSVLDEKKSEFKQVWLAPEDLSTVLTERTRRTIGLLHSLHDVLNSSTSQKNVIVIDSAERINPDNKTKVKHLISSLALDNNIDENSPGWKVRVIGQTEAWATGRLQELTGGESSSFIEVQDVSAGEVKEALHSNSSLSWLASHNDAVTILGNLRTLAWVMQAETVFQESDKNEMSLPVIADRLWLYWTDGKVKLQTLLMRIAEKEAMFERSFAISELDLEFSEAIDDSPKQFPLRINNKSNRLEFQHDLAADWSRFQRLKELKNDLREWGPLASNPLWHNALRMVGQQLLREGSKQESEWDKIFANAEKSKDSNPLAADILLDALCQIRVRIFILSSIRLCYLLRMEPS